MNLTNAIKNARAAATRTATAEAKADAAHRAGAATVSDLAKLRAKSGSATARRQQADAKLADLLALRDA